MSLVEALSDASKKDALVSDVVKLVDEETNEETSYQIVGPEEADIQAGLLSIQSPLAQALLAKEASDNVEVNTPRGTRYFEILEVSFQ